MKQEITGMTGGSGISRTICTNHLHLASER